MNSAWNAINFRSNLIKSLVACGYKVIVLAPKDKYASQLASLGCQYLPLKMDVTGKNPINDLLLFYRYFKVFRAEKPDIVLGFTIKPNIYGSLAARFLGIPTVNNITGLGHSFISKSWLSTLVKILYCAALAKSARVFFQNSDDLNTFVFQNIVPQNKCGILPGSGVDLKIFTPAPFNKSSKVRFLLMARLIKEKGITEYIKAATIIKGMKLNAEFYLAGEFNKSIASSIDHNTLYSWIHSDLVYYLGHSDSIQDEIKKADCVVLPSYGEGTPKSLLEASAMARPIITTDVPGCRDVVDDGITGYLCEVKDPEDLANKMIMFLKLNRKQRKQMGLKGRQKTEKNYDEKIVIKNYIDTIVSILN